MTICVTCGAYFRTSPYNSSSECDDCYAIVPGTKYDSDYDVDVDRIMNPSGKTRACIYDDNDDSHSS